ncbi:hypothetical protein MVEN_00609600 [Mycena venus]|uniref:Uncharacterized protein n=1 Tax=Mycena venus TaxID=2733690 RepID=A0A8H7D8C6_9AGAR|nr:hypothetical protein MVEN_00609600 [Mycena venus]
MNRRHGFLPLATSTACTETTKMQGLSTPDGTPVRQYRFPPFPPVPVGVKILPFNEFKEYGTRVVVDGDEVETCGLGIPTIVVEKKKKEKTIVAQNGTPLKKEWWDTWALSGYPLRGSYDPKLDRVDRFSQAAIEFSKEYHINSYQHLQSLWAKFTWFVGVTALAGSQSAAEADEEQSDDDDAHAPPFTTQATATDAEPLHIQQSETPVQPPIEDKTAAFLNNPAESTKIFLSSYMREHGLIWDRLKLVSAPHILRFFINFLLINKVLPECIQGLQEALKTIDLAGKELPLMHDISEALPDAFSGACQAHWGRKAGGFVSSDSSDLDPISDEPKAKRAKLVHSADEATEEIEIQTDRATLPESDNVRVSATQDVDMGAPADNAAWGSESWGSTGWGAGLETGATAIMDTADDGGWGSGSGWGDAAWGKSDAIANDPLVPQVPPAKLKFAPQPTLTTLLGPTALPLTHAPGIVEWSLRRIKSVSAPPSAVSQGEGAEAVERALETRMHRLVLEPWVGPAAAASAPHVLRSSNGALAPAVAASPEQPKPHDVLRDEITVLVEPKVAGLLCAGMGLCGTWVQLARVQDQEGVEFQDACVEADGKKKALTKAQKARLGLRYWYIDELVMIVPSFWAV